jgi:hypothetical protein
LVFDKESQTFTNTKVVKAIQNLTNTILEAIIQAAT